MKLALVLGIQQGNVVKPKLQGIKDNLEIDCFANITQFIDSALRRNCIYDRILILSTMLKSNVEQELYNYWSSTSKETQIVLMCRKGQDEQLATNFLSRFMTPVVAVMLVNSTTVTIIAEAVLRPTAELTQDYGIKDYMTMEFDDDVAYVEPEPEPVVEQKVEEKVEETEEQPKEKRTIFSALFGGKKKSKQSKPVPIVENNITSESSEVQEEVKEEVPEPVVPVVEVHTPVIEEHFEPIIEESIEDTSDFEPSFEEEPEVETPSSIKKSQLSLSNGSSLVEEDFGTGFEEETYEDVTEVVNDFAPQQDIEEDFGDAIEEYEEDAIEDDGLHEVDEDMSGVDVASAEENYRKSAEAPKVVTQTVVREVIRGGGNGKNNTAPAKLATLSGVYAGKYRKIVIVTGDRGTGITSTALNIAKTLAQKVEVLYFDCDIYNHGLLNYIDYAQFSNYEKTHMNGIKMCKSSLAFDNCVVSFDTNFDILTTDFSCDATVEELETAHEVVSERSDEYQVIVVDCPVDCLQYIPDFLMSGNTVLCVEGSNRGFMNMLCRLEANQLSNRFKKNIVSRGNMFVTKCNPSLDLGKLLKYIKAIFEPNGVDWLSMEIHKFNGQLSDQLLNDILEG